MYFIRLFLLLLLLVCYSCCLWAATTGLGVCAAAFVPSGAFLFPERQQVARALVDCHVSSRVSRWRRRRVPVVMGRLGDAASANDGGGDWSSALQARLEQQTRDDLVRAVLGSQTRLGTVRLIGQASVTVGGSARTSPSSSNNNNNKREESARTVPCVVLSRGEEKQQHQPSSSMFSDAATTGNDPRPCLLVPLGGGGSNSRSAATGMAGLRLLEFVAHQKLLSKSLLLRLNTVVVNRDGALFDNLPWSTWTVDPKMRNRDAAGNPVLARFHLGKRDAYNRMMGKDWQGKSLAMGNLARRLQYVLDRDPGDPNARGDGADSGEPHQLEQQQAVAEAEAASLASRILQLQIKEQEMVVAEIDYNLAICRQRQLKDNSADKSVATLGENLDRLLKEREEASQLLQGMRQKLDQLSNSASNDPRDVDGPSSSVISQVLQDVASWSTEGGTNEAPYWGATGYAPRLDTLQDVQDSLSGMYCSPYDLLKEIIADQLNADVIGAVLENTSLLEGTLSMGGAVILRRRTPRKSVMISGERLTIRDDEEDFGNTGVTGGETILVECDVDEAIGLAMACNVLVKVESDVCERGSVMMIPMEKTPLLEDPRNASSVRQTLPAWTTRDPLLSFIVEGQARNQSVAGRAAPLKIPRTTSSLLDTFFDKPRSPSSPSLSPKAMFPVDNPIKSLEDYDRLSNEDKARTLMSISNFDGRLPRRRVVRQSPAILDQLLLPLIDESTRWQFMIREAKQRGDMDAVRELEEQKSERQIAKEKAEIARSLGADAEAEKWEREADLYASLRADVTQDMGSYSRFLDRDEWYERQRASRAKKIDRKKFGTLLDGLE